MTAAVKRTVFATPRAAEFLELRALQAQTGQPVEAFGHVVVKELIDNALDAAESAGVAPVIDIAIDTETDDTVTFITVTDNGGGITPATVADVCDFNVLASDKARYRGPSRGAQGNALKTLLGIPAALGVTEPVIIDSCGVRHALRVHIDVAGDVVVEHDTGPGRTEGTSVTVPLPEFYQDDELEIDEARWAFGAALVNPHACVSTTYLGYSDDEQYLVSYEPAGGAWSKWTPSQPSSPHWYDLAAFAGLVGAYVRDISRTGVDIPLGRFIAEFDGLSGTLKQKAIRRAVPGVTHVSQLGGRDDLIAALHNSMCEHAKPSPPSRLGPVGPERFKALLHVRYWVQRFWYKKAELVVDGVPWIIEAAFAETSNPGDVFYAVNHGPSFGDPLGQAWLHSDGVSSYGAAGFLSAAGVRREQFDGVCRAAVVHVICAATQFVDKGKVALVVPEDVKQAAGKTLAGATKAPRREVDQRQKDAVKAERAARRAEQADRSDKWSIKRAVFDVLPDAKRLAGTICGVRTLWYKVRPLAQKLLGYDLDPKTYDYFSQSLLPEYERTVAPLPGVYYKARGEMHHPHDGRVVKLGTREVEAYALPPWQFDKLLYIEKEGLEEQLRPYNLGQKYDMGIIFEEGYSPTACRNLLARSEFREMTIFVLHDADVDGYNISRTLANETRRMPNHRIDVIDLGLTAPQVVELGLETDTFTRKKALPADLELDDISREWFAGVPFWADDAKMHYRCTRCELNEFSADALAEFIEEGLRRHGATAKVIPPADVMAQQVADARYAALSEVAADLVNISGMVRRLMRDYPDFADIEEVQVREWLTENPTVSWRSAVGQLVGDDVDNADGLADALREQLAQQLRGEEGEQ